MRTVVGPRVGLVVLTVGVLLAGCGGEEAPDVLLVPDDDAEVVATTTLEAVLGDQALYRVEHY